MQAPANDRLKDTPGWQTSDDGKSIHRIYKFNDFKAAWGFMSQAALLAEEIGHHPDWSNTYNKVEVSLTTHDAGGLTDKDYVMAKAMNGFAGEPQA